jgi:hypothetical protein
VTTRELGILLSGVPEQYGQAPIGYMYSPDLWVWATGFSPIQPLYTPFAIFIITIKLVMPVDQNVYTAWGLGAYMDSVPDPVAQYPVYVPTVTGFAEVISIKFYQTGPNQDMPVIGLNTTFLGAGPPRPLPFDRRRQVPDLPKLPDRAAPGEVLHPLGTAPVPHFDP